MTNIITVLSALLLTTAISGCSNPDEDARKAGFSNMAEMQEIQGKGFKEKSQYTYALSEVEAYARCNAQVSIAGQLAKDNGLEKLSDEAERLLKGLIFYEGKYDNSEIKSKAKILRTSEYNAYKDKVEKTDMTGDDLVTVLSDCTQKFRSKIDALCKTNEYICYGEKGAGAGAGAGAGTVTQPENLPDGLSRSQWTQRCEQFVSATNQCAAAPNVSKCTEIKMGYANAEMSRTYCAGSTPNFSLMGSR